jgi:DNA-binding transcriptional regulator YiaG
MPNIAKMLREEIARIARKEVKAFVAPVRKPAGRVRKDVASLKRRVATLEQDSKRLQALLKRLSATPPAAPAGSEATQRARVTAKGIRSLRRNLGLTQTEFARLAGVSLPMVGIWEKKEGALRVWSTTRAAILALRGLGAKAARMRLAELAKPTTPAKQGKAKRRGMRR